MSGGAHCNPSYRGPSWSGYSGSVWGFLVLMLVNLNQYQAGAEDCEGMRPSTDTGDDWEEIDWLLYLWQLHGLGGWLFESRSDPSYNPVSVALPGVHPPKWKRDGDMGLGKSGSWDSAPLAHHVGTPVREQKTQQLILSIKICNFKKSATARICNTNTQVVGKYR